MFRSKLAITLCVFFSFCISMLPAANFSELYEPSVYKEMPYRLMKPVNFDTKQKYPLIISLHGAGGRGNDNKKQLKDWNKQLANETVRKDFPCYVLAPQSKSLWNAQTLAFIKEVIATLPAVDMDRIYILGHSMGGHGTFIYIQLEPNYFAAAAPPLVQDLRKQQTLSMPNSSRIFLSGLSMAIKIKFVLMIKS